MNDELARPLNPGERVNYRPLAEIESALEDGYLELEYVSDGSTVHETIQRGFQGEPGHGDYYSWILNLTPGHRAETSSVEYADGTSLEAVIARADLDIHAFRWYPRSVTIA